MKDENYTQVVSQISKCRQQFINCDLQEFAGCQKHKCADCVQAGQPVVLLAFFYRPKMLTVCKQNCDKNSEKDVTLLLPAVAVGAVLPYGEFAWSATQLSGWRQSRFPRTFCWFWNIYFSWDLREPCAPCGTCKGTVSLLPDSWSQLCHCREK